MHLNVPNKNSLCKPMKCMHLHAVFCIKSLSRPEKNQLAPILAKILPHNNAFHGFQHRYNFCDISCRFQDIRKRFVY